MVCNPLPLPRRKNQYDEQFARRADSTDMSICSATSARITRTSDRSHRSSTPAGPVSCLLHRQANNGVEVCSVSRQMTGDDEPGGSESSLLASLTVSVALLR